MKIILSRKGFDTKTGGIPSPILDNKFISLPIPEEGSGIGYHELMVSEKLTYQQLLSDLSSKTYQEAHQDPDLRSSMSYRTQDWKPLFGQHGSAQGLLHNNGVGSGDLFLFFGYFKHVQRTSNGIRYLSGANPVHAIFGYLQIDRIINIATDIIPKWALYHPHVVLQAKYKGQKNVLYVASEHLSFNSNLPGAGCFQYHDGLVLTAKWGNMSDWELPGCFENEESNFKIGVKISKLPNDKLHVRTKGQGQEIFISNKPEIVQWTQELVNKSRVFV